MLRACRSALKPGGRIAFSTIYIADELPADVRWRIGRGLPAGVYSRVDHERLLRSARFANVERRDVSDEFLRIQRSYHESFQRHERALRRALGDSIYDERQTGRERSIKGLEAGALKRAILSAERPPARR